MIMIPSPRHGGWGGRDPAAVRASRTTSRRAPASAGSGGGGGGAGSARHLGCFAFDRGVATGYPQGDAGAPGAGPAENGRAAHPQARRWSKEGTRERPIAGDGSGATGGADDTGRPGDAAALDL